MDKDRLETLVQTYINAKKSDEFGEREISYCDLMESYRKWLRENILDYKKLTNYSDAEFSEKFGEMYLHTDGAPNHNNRNLRMHFNSSESRIAIRSRFEKLIDYILNYEGDKIEILEKLADPDGRYKIKGIGEHILSSLISAKYPEVPPINGTSREFFDNIGDPLPANYTDGLRTIAEFFEDVIKLSNGELGSDDANHIFWYSKNIESGRRFMELNYQTTFEKKAKKKNPLSKNRKKILSYEEEFDVGYADLMAVHEAAMRKKNGA